MNSKQKKTPEKVPSCVKLYDFCIYSRNELLPRLTIFIFAVLSCIAVFLTVICSPFISEILAAFLYAVYGLELASSTFLFYDNDNNFFGPLIVYSIETNPKKMKENAMKELYFHLGATSAAIIFSLVLISMNDINDLSFAGLPMIVISIITAFLYISPVIFVLQLLIYASRVYTLNFFIRENKPQDDNWENIKSETLKVFAKGKKLVLLPSNATVDNVLPLIKKEIYKIENIDLYDEETKMELVVVVTSACLAYRKDLVSKATAEYEKQMKVSRGKEEKETEDAEEEEIEKNKNK